MNANTNLLTAIKQEQLHEKLAAFDDDQDSSKLFTNFENLKTFISTNYTLGANSTYYINSNNEWTDNVGEAKFVISVGADPKTDVTITKKDTYCELTYDKDGHITVKATPAKKYIDIITADEKSLKQTAPDLKCPISDDDKKTALKNLKDLLNNNDFKNAYNKKRGIMQAIPHMFLNNDCLEELKKASSVENATNILKDTKKYSNILAALNATTISTTYKTQDDLTKAIGDIQYLNEMLVSSTIPRQLPLFSGDTNEEYITKIDGDTTVYTTDEATPKEYKVKYDSSQNTVTIEFDNKTYTYTVSETECTLAENNVPDKDLFEYFVYMALRNDPTKQKAFAQKLLSLEYNKIGSDMDRRKKAKVTRLIAASKPDLYKSMMNGTLKNGDKTHLYLDENGNILETKPDDSTPYVKFFKNDRNGISFVKLIPQKQ